MGQQGSHGFGGPSHGGRVVGPLKRVGVQGNVGSVGGPGEQERLRVAGCQQQRSGKIQTVNPRGMWFDGRQHASESEDT